MELPQSRQFGTEGKKPTHDFLSLYNHSSFPHQDPRPSPQGIYLKTRDFLQPLEMVGKDIDNAKETESPVADETSTMYSNNEKAAAAVSQVPRPPSSSSSSSVEHVLPGGIGTYTISHISSFSHQLQVPKPERSSTCAPPLAIQASACSTEKKMSANTTTNHEVNKAVSNSASSYSGGSFSLWGESVVEKGAAKKATTSAERQVTREPVESLGLWTSEQQQQQLLQTPCNIFRSSFSSIPSSKENSRKSQSFMEMMKSGKGLQEDEDDVDDFIVKKDISSQKELTVKVDGKSNDQKANTPRSKHSATEQRRRSKINDRFQILRDLIPLNDQKRDKASFLLEVIEYIQFLQEKVNKYEGSYQGWNQESVKLMPWRSKHGPGETMVHHSRATKDGPGPGLLFAGKFNDSSIPITQPILANTQAPADNDRRTGATYKSIDHLLAVANKAIPFPVQIQPDIGTPVGRSCGLAQPFQRPLCDGENMVSQPEAHLWQSLPCTTGRPAAISKEQEAIPIEGGTISISNVYSQGLLNNLTQALQRSGVDLSRASISVQIDLAKHKSSKLSSTSSAKDQGDPSFSNRARSRGTSSGDDSDRTQKRLKTEHN